MGATPPDELPRPIADVPPAALADGTAVAKAWLVELVRGAPLQGAAAIDVAQLAARGPALCAVVLRAIGSDHGLRELLPGGGRAVDAARIGDLAGASDPAATAVAVARLRIAVSAILARELGGLDATATAALAARTAAVCDVVTEAALRSPRGAGAVGDERASGGAPALAEPRDVAPAPAPASQGATPLAEVLERFAADGEEQPFAVLAIEVDDVERLQAADGAAAATAVSAVERAAVSAAPGSATVVRERPGRMWIVAAGTGRGDGRALAARIVEASDDAAVLRRASLTVSVGVAICPDDASDPDVLAAIADEGLFAARSAGLRLA